MLSSNILVCGLGRHCEYMLGFVRVARQLYMGKQPKLVSLTVPYI